MRFYVGVVLFCVGLFLPLLALIVPFLGLPLLVKTLLSAMLIVGGPEIFIILGIIFAGKKTMDFIKTKFKSFLFPKSISRMRHYIGVFCMLLSIVASWVLMYFFVLTDLAIEEEVKLILLGSIDLLFASSFFILGAPFWNKLINLFTWKVSV